MIHLCYCKNKAIVPPHPLHSIKYPSQVHVYCWYNDSISQKLCTRFMLCCVFLSFGTGWFYLYPSGLLHWHWGNHTIAPVPVKQPWRIWINGSYKSANEWRHYHKTKNNNAMGNLFLYTVRTRCFLPFNKSAKIGSSHSMILSITWW